MSYFVYVLYSPSFKKIYIGYTSKLQERVHAHNLAAIKGWTIRYRPWELIHTEIFSTKSEALKREDGLFTFTSHLLR